jgi:hypothetical protein
MVQSPLQAAQWAQGRSCTNHCIRHQNEECKYVKEIESSCGFSKMCMPHIHSP